MNRKKNTKTLSSFETKPDYVQENNRNFPEEADAQFSKL